MFERRDILLNKSQIEKIESAKIALFGLGGVGGYILDSLIRMGIKTFYLIDGDRFDETNLNRQLLSNLNNIGKLKTEVGRDYILSINKNVEIKLYSSYINENNIKELDLDGYYIIDAIDDIKAKVALAKLSQEKNLKIISMMGAGNRLNANFIVSDINKTEYDPLSKKMRKLLKDEGINHLKVVYTKDEAVKTDNNIIGSISYTVGMASLVVAREVINDIINN